MKIYYYKQQQNTFELFGKRNSLVRPHILVISLLVVVAATLGYFGVKLTPSSVAVNTLQPAPALPADTAQNTIEVEAQATTINLQKNIEQDAKAVEEAATSMPPLNKPSLNTAIHNKLQTVVIRPHDTLGKICSRLAVHKKEVNAIMQTGQAEALKRLKPGQKLFIAVNNHTIQELSYSPDPMSTLLVSRTGNNQFKMTVKTTPLETKQSVANFVVYGSIANAAQKAGLNSKKTAQLASIFKDSVDFVVNHTGDKVRVLSQDYFLNGKKVKDGDIVAAEYKTATNTYQAVRFTDPKGNSGYYAPDGTSMEKRFLPAPLKFTRISSLFNPKRWHPILHRFRHHQGVDYAAPYGTPIKSVANGKIAVLGRQGGYGNTILVKHDSSYSTLYGHLSKYASGLKVGSNVQQGQVIGFVGSSGLATGPHLHFEFRINGVHRNPLTVALPNGKSITHAYRNKFHLEFKKLIAKLDAYRNTTRS